MRHLEGRRTPHAVNVALLFTAHPVQTQSITYVVQRMNELAVLFMLLAYLAARSATGRRRRQLAWAGALAAWVLALGCKPIALEDVHKHCSTENAGRVCARGFSRFAK